ncbi:MAG: hypothetical protein Q8898_16360, partial [Bacillota bacterium]|nr:hypothetical protein [Bacillota bacterium]
MSIPTKYLIMDSLNFLNTTDPSIIEQLYEQYRIDPQSVEPGWRMFFEGFEFAQENYQKQSFDV